MKKLFIVADVHSFYFEMIDALCNAGYNQDNPDHIFVSLGDLLDRGDYPVSCLNFVNMIPADRKILIRGNHEDLLEECLKRKEFYQHDKHNGTMRTIMSLGGREVEDVYNWLYSQEYGEKFPEFRTDVKDYHEVFDKVAEYPPLQLYLDSLVDFAEVGSNVFVHGWIPSRKKSPDKDWRKGDWSEARWFNGMEKWKQGSRLDDTTIFCGHWHTSWGHAVLEHEGTEWGPGASYAPFVGEGIVALDACTVRSGFVNCYTVEITDDEFKTAFKEG